MTDSETALCCFFIGLLWGSTNSLIKKSTADITKVTASNSVYRFINEVGYLIANWEYLLFFLINQLGSILYFLLLQSVDLSLIVPTVNALTFIITAFVGFLTGEDTPSSRKFLGTAFILSGITLCVCDKTYLSRNL